MFALQTRDLSHIELARSDNISSLSAVKAYRVNEVDISTEEKKSKNRRIYFLLLLLFLLVIWFFLESSAVCRFFQAVLFAGFLYVTDTGVTGRRVSPHGKGDLSA